MQLNAIGALARSGQMGGYEVDFRPAELPHIRSYSGVF
jgi:hypothetical protein